MTSPPPHWLAVLPELSVEVTALAAKPLALQWAATRSALDQQEALFAGGRAIDPGAVASGAEARAREQLTAWVAAGWLQEETDVYRLHGVWREGRLELNGRALGLPF